MNRSDTLDVLVEVFLGFAIAVIAGCGNVNKAGLPTCTGACSCTESTCSCQSGGNCTFGPPMESMGGGGIADGAAPPSTELPNDVTYTCAEKNQCDLTCGSGCTSTCDGRSTCAGTCTSNCTSSCAGTSDCTLTTGTNSEVTCAGGSTCKVSLDTGSTLTCQGESTCNLDCPKGGCTAECAGAANCTVVCGGSTPCRIQCNGMTTQDCAAGTMCRGVCPRMGGGGDSGSHRDAGR